MTANVISERSRALRFFVGNSPAPCMVLQSLRRADYDSAASLGQLKSACGEAAGAFRGSFKERRELWFRAETVFFYCSTPKTFSRTISMNRGITTVIRTFWNLLMGLALVGLFL